MCEGEGTQGLWRRCATCDCRLSRQLLVLVDGQLRKIDQRIFYVLALFVYGRHLQCWVVTAEDLRSPRRVPVYTQLWIALCTGMWQGIHVSLATR